MICSAILSPEAGQWQRASAPSQPRDHEGNPLIHLKSFCNRTTMLVFTFSTIFNKLHDISKLHYKINFALGDFAQL